MSYGTSISIADAATPALERMRATLAERADINSAVAAAVAQQCRDYVAAYRPSRHATARALGAVPTNFVGYAIEGIHFTADAQSAEIDFDHPWFSVVGHDVDIAPRDGRFLAIPVAASSYGQRLRARYDQDKANGGRFFKSGNQLFWGIPYPGQKFMQALYILVASVHQPQDRERLPSDEEIQDGAREALAAEIEKRIHALEAQGA